MLHFSSQLLPFTSIVISFLLGCVDVAAQSATTETSSPVILPSNTPVILHLKESLYKKGANPGYSLEFEVGYDVALNGQTFIQSGTPVTGIFRQIEHSGKGAAKLLIDLGPAQTVSGEKVPLASTGVNKSDQSGMSDAIGWGAEAPPIIPVLAVMSLFEKKVLLDKDAWGGVWPVAHVAQDVAVDAAKLKAAQEPIAENQKAAQTELCGVLASPDFSNWGSSERVALARRSGLGDPREAELLRRAGELDGAIEVYQKLLASGQQDPPCSDKYSKIVYFSFGAPTFLWVGGFPEEQQEQLLRSFRGDLHLALAGLYREKRDFVHAISEYRTAVQLKPDDEQARIGLISTLQESGDLDAAVAESKEAIRFWPDRPYFHYLLGSVLVKKNDSDAAIVELQRALNMAKNHFSPANCELGRAFEQKGNLEAAFRQYRTAYRAHVDDDDCRAAYERLKLQLK